MDRREVLMASLAGAAAMGISSKRSFSEERDAGKGTSGQNAAGAAVAEAPLVCIYDYEAAAKRKLSVGGWEYFNGGSADEITLRRNRSALDGLQLKPRVLVDVTKIDTSCQLLGYKMEHPILLAPTSSHQLAYPDAEVATAQGAAAAKAILVASTNSNRSIEDICKAASTPIWFQLYVDDDRGVTRALIERAEAAGCKTMVITVDNPLAFARNREERVSAQMPKLPFPNLGVQAGPGARGRSRRHFNWSDLEWIQSFTKTPIVLKGIMNPDDADQAAHRDVAAIIVSNHGGRVLDTGPATIEVLPAVVDRVAGRVPVLFDGGVRRGTDVLKGLACGASAVLIGRPYLYGLSVNGPDGVRDVVNILRTELQAAMAMTGRTRLLEIDRSLFWKSRDYSS
ncbi:MAG TPA: alpha-hydroxy acid oxidase [Terracidiphilus sp.]|nr:alpha-hydroxy acid oxidase [Terracidiphilus sp.]